MADLPKDLQDKLDGLIDSESHEAFTSGQTQLGLAILNEAWGLLPEPKNSWGYYGQTIGSIALQESVDHDLVDDAEIWLERTKFAYPQGFDQAQQLLDVWETQYKYVARTPDAAEFAAQTLERWGAGLFESKDPRYLRFARTGERSEGAAAASSSLQPETLDDDRIEKLSEEGSALLDDDWQAALAKWTDALALVPEPKTAYAESTWLYTSIGDAHHTGEQWSQAVEALRVGLTCPGGHGNGYLWLRLGESQYELGQLDDAANSLLSAYLLEGDELFADEDPQYRGLLVDRGHIDS